MHACAQACPLTLAKCWNFQCRVMPDSGMPVKARWIEAYTPT